MELKPTSTACSLAHDSYLESERPFEGGGMVVSPEMLELAREIEACDVRLGFLPANDRRCAEMRGEIERRRREASQRLAELEAENDWNTADESPPSSD